MHLQESALTVRRWGGSPAPADGQPRRHGVAGLRLPLLRGRARPLAELAAADEASSGVGQRQRKTPGTAPRGGGSHGPSRLAVRLRLRLSFPTFRMLMGWEA